MGVAAGVGRADWVGGLRMSWQWVVALWGFYGLVFVVAWKSPVVLLLIVLMVAIGYWVKNTED